MGPAIVFNGRGGNTIAPLSYGGGWWGVAGGERGGETMDLAIFFNEEGANKWNPPSFESDEGSGRWMQGERDGGEGGGAKSSVSIQ